MQKDKFGKNKRSFQKCCLDECIRKFNNVDTFDVMHKYYLKKFDKCRKYGIFVGGQMHYVGNNQKRKFVMLIGSEVCATTW